MSSQLKKALAVAAVSAFSLMVHAADNVVEVGSAEDPETGRWIGDVTALTNYLHTYKTSSTTVKLAKGDYDLAGIQMEVEGSEYGKSHLVASGVKIVGMGEKREDVRLIGDGTCRIYRMIADTDAKLENLTITNGYAQAIEGVEKSGHGGGICGSPTVTNCVITNCKADGSGGGLYGSSKIYVSDILNNSAKSGGGGAFQPYRIINSLVAGNSSAGNGGGIHGNAYGLIAGSTITRNTSGVSGGGICAVTSVTNCVISLNQSVQSGSAFYSFNKATAFAYDCTICSNKMTGTGDIYGTAYKYTIVGGRIFGNYAIHGGAAANCDLLNGVDIYSNYAEGYGGGVYSCTVSNCILRSNFKGEGQEGHNAYSSFLYGCDISGTGIHSGYAVNCSFHDIVLGTAIDGNPYVSGLVWSGHVYSGIPVCTNCIFRNNIVTNYSHSLFSGQSTPDRSGSIVNCTVVSNKCGKTLNYMSSKDYPVSVVNCVFVWNEAYNSKAIRDIYAAENVSSNGLRFAYCAYGTAGGKFAAGKDCDLKDSSDGPMYQFGVGGFGDDPKFAFKDPKHPFEPKRVSPLRGLGLPGDWMSASTDIRGSGYPRLRDGKVDIGCYQCWIDPVGAVISVR